MTFNNLIKNSFKTVIENPSITLFFVLFLIIINILGAYLVLIKTSYIFFVVLLCLFFTMSAFISGWFQIIKEGAQNTLKEKNTYGLFLEGIGKNILSVISAFLLYFILFIIFIFTARMLAILFFGHLDFFTKDLNILSQDQNALIQYFNNLTTDQKYALYGWQFSFFLAMAVLNFLMLFYFPAVFFTQNKNPILKSLIGFKNNIIFVFKNFFGALGINILFYIFNIILAVLNTIFARNAIISVLVLFIYIYFISTAVMIIFNYYEKKYNSNNRPDSIGENEACS